MIRLCIEPDLIAGAAVDLSQDQQRYLVAVMRLKDGDRILVFNGRHGEWRARLIQAGRRDFHLTVEDQVRDQAFGPDIDLVMALVKRAPLETVIEKSTELGVRRIRLVTTLRTNADHSRLDRLVAIAREAAEQTGRLDPPAILAPEPLEKTLKAWDATRRLIFCDEAGDDPDAPWGGAAGRAPPLLEALGAAAPGPLAVLIGPEGGFDPRERAVLRELAFVVPVGLGPRILRADTAALAALALCQAARGDWARGA